MQGDKVKPTNQKPATTTTSLQMDKLNSNILKTAIESIPLLTMDNFTLWRNHIKNLLDLQELRKPLTDPKGLSLMVNFFNNGLLNVWLLVDESGD
ncbi:hypothetical protein VP01_6813g1 [Puccinia sorghi]|uniref:Uncharacterized protein n=1 Tax=Puccinia sorghi TaxID=27349 RepID=A0A0L6UEH0_9BASI|nr:hypothetical protein VP01_6813g1 [Puccinia sorghi]